LSEPTDSIHPVMMTPIVSVSCWIYNHGIYFIKSIKLESMDYMACIVFCMLITMEFGESQTSYRRRIASESGQIIPKLPIPTMFMNYQQQ